MDSFVTDFLWSTLYL